MFWACVDTSLDIYNVRNRNLQLFIAFLKFCWFFEGEKADFTFRWMKQVQMHHLCDKPI